MEPCTYDSCFRNDCTVTAGMVLLVSVAMKLNSTTDIVIAELKHT